VDINRALCQWTKPLRIDVKHFSPLALNVGIIVTTSASIRMRNPIVPMSYVSHAIQPRNSVVRDKKGDQDMSAIVLTNAVSRILANGPTRVVISEDGSAVSPKRAKEAYRITPDVVFIRDDGWSLGAPKRFADIAEAIWENKWRGVLLRPLSVPITYGEYLRVKSVMGDPVTSGGN